MQEHGIDYQAMMREGPNPLSGEVATVHGPYAPLWDEAFEDETAAKALRGAWDEPPRRFGGAKKPMSPSRSAPAGSAHKAAGKMRARERRKEREEAAAGEEGGSSRPVYAAIAPTGKVVPEEVLDEQEMEKVAKQVQREMEELRKRRAEGMRRRVAVQLDQQRQMEVSRQLERDQEEWQHTRKAALTKKLALACNAQKKHVMEHETIIAKKEEKEAAEKAADLERLKLRWDTQAAEREEARQQMRRQQQERTDTELAAAKSRVEIEQRRAEARELAVAEYKASQAEGSKAAHLVSTSDSLRTLCSTGSDCCS